PSNIMVRLEGEPVLMDFGLAKPMQSIDQNLTATGAVMGTPGYMSPEQVLDASHTGPGTDIYSLGVILYELVTGRRPFEGPVAAVYAQILHSAPAPPSSVRPGLDVQLNAICLKALAKKPEERFPTAQALADVLVRYLNEQTIPALPWPQQPVVAVRPVQDDTRLTCPSCGKQLRVPASLQGKRLKCPRCSARLGTPSDAPRPAVTSTGATAAVVPTPSPAPGDTLEETRRQPPVARVAPVRPARRGSPVFLIVVLTLLATALVWGLIVFLNRDTSTDDPPKKEGTTNSLGMRLIRIEPGKFRMGSPDDEESRDSDEGPQHEVEITRPFYLGATEVTVGQFRQFLDSTGEQTEAERDGKGGYGLDADKNTFLDGPAYNWKNPGYRQTDDHPVVNVTWNDAIKFCEWLSKKEGKKYELPTEAEWEYACRAGTTTRYWTGNDAESLVGAANVADASARRRFPEVDWRTIAGDDGYAVAAPVGRFKPNPWGLYDMHGNVWEWCADAPRLYENRPVKDPRGPVGAAERVLRGGSWFGHSFHGRCADRHRAAADTRNINYGFRVLLRPDP
ncbi:MAG TPA: SUMF1/EgtB/PvdO family nonheme iron enzyme, partial [Gemmataceae bacterium]|nr:SUMF1/EgtB/PvdO family nonheme iron enzyme [Gemmataceae bacterium]